MTRYKFTTDLQKVFPELVAHDPFTVPQLCEVFRDYQRYFYNYKNFKQWFGDMLKSDFLDIVIS